MTNNDYQWLPTTTTNYQWLYQQKNQKLNLQSEGQTESGSHLRDTIQQNTIYPKNFEIFAISMLCLSMLFLW